MEYHHVVFHNHDEAGKYLAKKLLPYKYEKPVILAMPREGIPVAAKVAQALEAPLDVIVARTLTAPDETHMPFGAIASGDVLVLDRSIQATLNISQKDTNAIIEQERKELARNMKYYNSGAHISHTESPHTLIIIDDGLAPGITVRAAIEAANILYNPKTVVFASPVCAHETVGMIKHMVSDIVCVNNPNHLYSISNWYDDYYISDEEASYYLKQLQMS
jgi:putative phosphoribosyl transferase